MVLRFELGTPELHCRENISSEDMDQDRRARLNFKWVCTICACVRAFGVCVCGGG